MNKYKDDMVLYFNILIENQATKYTRRHFTLIDLLKEQGGLIKISVFIAAILMKPFIFKRHDLQVFQDHVEIHNEREFNYNQEYFEKQFSRYIPTEFYLWMHDLQKQFSKMKLSCMKMKQKVVPYPDEKYDETDDD